MNDDLDVLARTILGESEAWNRLDAEAIACVILNRAEYPNWPRKISEVCLQPWQFSCWNQNDPQRVRIIQAEASSNRWFAACIDIAKRALNGEIKDITKGSTHYYATYVKKPKWARGHTPVYEVHHKNSYEHIFYNDIDTPAPKDAAEALHQSRPLSSTGTAKGATAGVVGAGAIGALAENAESITPVFSFADTLAGYGQTAIIVVLLMAIAYMMWRRYDDRRNGLR